MTQEELNKIIENHQHWLNEDCEGWEDMKADLRGATLCFANLAGADLTRANLNEASLCNANLRGTILNGASLCGTNLDQANLHGAELTGAVLVDATLNSAYLVRANLFGANLDRASLCGANLREANLSRVCSFQTDFDGAILDRTNFAATDFSQAKNVPYIPMVCPEEGSFIGWKKVKGYIIKLEIPAKAKRSSAASRKCRCEYAKVLGIYTIDGKKAEIDAISSFAYRFTKYKIGEMVYPDSFDENRWNECTHGIHFFINRQEAINY